jgi:hypothetical protein
MSIIEGMDNGICFIFFLIASTFFYIFYNVALFFYNRIAGQKRTIINVENDQEQEVEGDVECAICMSTEYKNKVELVCNHNYCGIIYIY